MQSAHFYPNDQRLLAVAEGYVALGMFLAAKAELDQIDPGAQSHPEELAVRVEIYRGLKNWPLVQLAAREMAMHEPHNVRWALFWAAATRRCESIDAAICILLSVVRNQPHAAILHFKLACYACLRGDLHSANESLKAAFVLDPRFRITALADVDLEPFWSSVSCRIGE